MAFVHVEDVGTTVRRKLTPHRRLQVWESTGGRCVICGQEIDCIRERWIAEHIRALELGGIDHLSNMGPAHEACARGKTQADHHRAAKAKRQKIQHLGAGKGSRPLPCGRQSRWKKKMNGTIVPRD